MGLEIGATYISDLVATNPTGGDPKAQGDDHIRLIKAALQASFPGISGAVDATHTELDAVADGAEGSTSFTPVIQGSTVAGTGTYTNQVGQYVVVGGIVFFWLRLIWSAHTGTGDLQIAGLPYTSLSANLARIPLSTYSANIALTAGHVLQASVSAGTKVIEISSYPSGGGATGNVPMDSTGALYVSGHYLKA